MASKRHLGISYLLGTGLGSTVTLTWFFLNSEVVDIGLVVATVTAGILSGTFVFMGYWMYHTGIVEDTVWTVARWSAIGHSIPVLIGAVLLRTNPDSLLRTIVSGIFINHIAFGSAQG